MNCNFIRPVDTHSARGSMLAVHVAVWVWACVLSAGAQGGVALTTCQVCGQNDCVNPCPAGSPPGSSPPASSPRSHSRGVFSMRVRAQHPLEASVKIHQMVKVLGSSANQQNQAGPPAPAGLRVQRQTLRGVGINTQHSGFKYCFTQVKEEQCGSPLPGLRSKEMCCRGAGRAWGITECVLCPPNTGHQGNSSCPAGFHTVNGTQCVDVNECEEPGVCEHGVCVNTRGSYSCVCRAGFILDASHGLCISQRVISEERSQCYRVLGSGSGPSSCSLPIHKNITKQICCCSRVGKAWGDSCQRCPYFASEEFKDICPAGPGYHYSASALQFHQRASGSAQLVTPGNQGNQDNQLSRTSILTQGSNTGSGSRQQNPSTRGQPQGSSGSSGSDRSSDSDRSRGSDGSRGSVGSSGSAGTSGSDGSRGSDGSSTSAGSRSSAGTSGSDGSRASAGTRISAASRGSDGSSTSAGSRGSAGTSGSDGSRGSATSRGLDGSSTSAGSRGSAGSSGSDGSTASAGSRGSATSRGSDGSRSSDGSSTSAGSRGSAGSSGSDGSTASAGSRGSATSRGSDGSRSSDGSSTSAGSRGSAGSSGSDGSTASAGSRGSAGSRASAGSSGSDGTRASAGSSGSDGFVSGPVRAALPLLPSKTDSTPSAGAAGGPNQTPRPGATVLRTAGGQKQSASSPLSPVGREASPRPLPLPVPVQPTVRPARVQTSVHSACDRPGVCGAGRCVALAGGRHTCRCDEGYQLNSQRTHCRDVDECQLGPCSNGRCDNTAGSYKCVCHRGYQLDGNTCTDLDECEDPLRCPGQECVNNQGSYRCVSCQSGHGLVNGLCTDLDECENPLRCPGQECVNNQGSYRCVSCQSGYGLVNGLCTDVDECRQSPCPNGDCENTPGSYRCVCHHGYRLQVNTCKDIDECVDLSQCPGQMCVNSVGSYHCVSCRPGYTLHNRQCNDLDECVSEGVCGTDSVCVNTLGSFTCDCLPGYRTTGLTSQCQDINECSEGDFCFPTGECVNIPGSYQCVCQQGYTPGNNGTVCLDEDECVSLQGVCGAAVCHNLPGSFTCVCEEHGHEFQARTRQCVMTQGRASLPATPSFSHDVTTGRGSPPDIPVGGPGDLRECYYSLELGAPCRLLAANTTLQECCCTAGEGWGMGCQYLTCPAPNTDEYQLMCPSGRGYVTTGSTAFSYTDVDECKRFHPEVCTGGVCVNNIPGYTCYCPSGFIYHHTLLECVDVDECEQEDSCPAGLCVNTVGSYFCICQPPLVLDHSQRTCINSTHQDAEEGLSLCWQQVSADLVCQSPLGRRHISFQDCCCFYGQGWGLQCAFCPRPDTEEYADLCRPVLTTAGEGFADPFGGEFGRRLGPGGAGGAAPPHRGPYGAEDFDARGLPDRGYRGVEGGGGYDDYLPAGGQITPGTYSLPDAPGRSYHGAPRPSSFGLPPDPRSETSFRARPPLSLPEGRPIGLGPFPGGGAYVPRGGGYVTGGGAYVPRGGVYNQEEEDLEEEEEPWRPRPPFPGFTGRGGPQRGLSDGRYDSLARLSGAEDCGILGGCENGRCVRVEEGYTCDCYHGYRLDITLMTCRDMNECEEGGPEPQCVNARCINTQGSFRCVCWRGYVTSHRPNHCTAA